MRCMYCTGTKLTIRSVLIRGVVLIREVCGALIIMILRCLQTFCHSNFLQKHIDSVEDHDIFEKFPSKLRRLNFASIVALFFGCLLFILAVLSRK